MFFFVFGIRPRTRALDSPKRRVAWCPICGGERHFAEARRVNYLELFFIPILPVGKPRDVMACTQCTFDAGPMDEVTSTTVRANEWDEEASSHRSMRTPRSRDAQKAASVQIHCVFCGESITARPTTGPRRIECPSCRRDFVLDF